MKILQMFKFCLEELRAVDPDDGDIPWSKQKLYETWKSYRKAAQEQTRLVAELRAEITSLRTKIESLQSQLDAATRSKLDERSELVESPRLR